MKKFFKNTYLAFMLLILYIPIIVLIMFSFNSGNSGRNFQGWSWKAYGELFQESSLWQSVSVTLIVASVSTLVAVVIGTFAALGLSKTKKITRNLTLGITNIPLVNADIVTAVSLMLLFVAFAFNFGIFTLILAHISFNIPYVIITVLPKIREIDNAQLEASQDLGASPWYTLRKIVFPTIKPAVIAGAAIAFAMSFDDFIISYFTGGTAANVSTYIYSLKRVQPYINAFSTFIIIIVSILIISWNAYKVIKKQNRIRNERIINQTYRDKKIIRLEKNLNKYYLNLNAVKSSKFNKKKPNFELFQPITKLEEDKAIININKKIVKNTNLIKKINNLEVKLKKEQIWVQQIAEKITEKKADKENKSRLRREKFYFLRWPWKLIAILLLTTGIFATATAFYIQSNNYDLTVANWGNYITPKILKGFESKYNVKVKYTTYDDNESLYAKLATTSYDVMVPSDYMVEKLATEDRLLPLDELEKNRNFGINKDLNSLMEKYQFTINVGAQRSQTKNLTDYSVPYFWGDLVLVFNTVQNPNLLNELKVKDNSPENANWDVIKTAAEKNKKIVLSDDMRNIFMLGLTTLNYQKHEAGNDYINPHSIKDIEDAAAWLSPILKSPNTRLENDQIVDTVAIKKGWDIAVMYNGDLLGAINQEAGANNYTISRPYYGTNIWNDDMVISKKTRNTKLSYEFIKYMMQADVQKELSKELGYTSPVQTAIDNVKNSFGKQIQKDAYIPGEKQIAPPNTQLTKGYYNGLYKRTYEADMQSAFNKLTAEQDSNIGSLLIKLMILTVIIIIFIATVVFIK